MRESRIPQAKSIELKQKQNLYYCLPESLSLPALSVPGIVPGSLSKGSKAVPAFFFCMLPSSLRLRSTASPRHSALPPTSNRVSNGT